MHTGHRFSAGVLVRAWGVNRLWSFAVVACVAVCSVKAGDNGQQGLTGTTGQQGPKGDRGPIGDPGPVGQQGPAGPSSPGMATSFADQSQVPFAVNPFFRPGSITSGGPRSGF